MTESDRSSDPPTGRRNDPSTRPSWWRVRWVPDDDLLEGFDRAGRPHGLRGFFATTIAASLLVWDLAFSLGAYHTVFYYRLFQILVVSTVLLLGSILLRRQVRVRPWMRVLLAVPLLWLLLRGLGPFGDETGATRVLDLILAVMVLVSMPFTVWALARIVAPDYFLLPHRRLKTFAAIIVVLVGVGGFLVGQFNNRFTTCRDYVVAGDYQPPNCSEVVPGRWP